jgi:hypothetical protein
MPNVKIQMPNGEIVLSLDMGACPSSRPGMFDFPNGVCSETRTYPPCAGCQNDPEDTFYYPNHPDYVTIRYNHAPASLLARPLLGYPCNTQYHLPTLLMNTMEERYNEKQMQTHTTS